LKKQAQNNIRQKKEEIMGKEKKLFKSEEPKNTLEVSTFLHELADRLAEGQVVLRQGEQELTLHLPQDLVLEIEFEEEYKGDKGIQRKLEVELKWYEGREDAGPVELG
jgi:amphi-Trp domain-containing protein